MRYVSDVSECAVCESECIVYVSGVSECSVCEDECMRYVSDVSECAVCEDECIGYMSDVSECAVCEDECMRYMSDVSECAVCEDECRTRKHIIHHANYYVHAGFAFKTWHQRSCVLCHTCQPDIKNMRQQRQKDPLYSEVENVLGRKICSRVSP